MEIKARILAGNKCYFILTKLLRSRLLSSNLKSQIHQTLIKHVVAYCSETWIIKKIDETVLIVFERKVLRKTYGPCKDESTGDMQKIILYTLNDNYKRSPKHKI